MLIVGIWAVMAGIFEISAGFAPGETAGTRALFFLTGLVSVAFGVVLLAHPNIGAFALALLFGLYSLISGVSLIVMGVDTRRTGKNLHSVMADAARAAQTGRVPARGSRFEKMMPNGCRGLSPPTPAGTVP